MHDWMFGRFGGELFSSSLDVLSYIYKKGNSVVEKDLEKAFDYAQKAYTELKNQG